MIAGIYSKLGTNVPYKVLTKCSYFLRGSESKIATLASDWLTYKTLIIFRSFYFKYLSEVTNNTF